MNRRIATTLVLALTLALAPAWGQNATFSYQGEVQGVALAFSAGNSRETLDLGGDLSLTGSTWPEGSTSPLPAGLTLYRLFSQDPERAYRDALDRCSRLALIAQARPDRYRFRVWIAVPPEQVVAASATRIDVNLAGSILYCHLTVQ